MLSKAGVLMIRHNARHNEGRENIEGILRLLPATENVYVIVGSSWSEQFWSEELTASFSASTTD